MQLKEIQSQIDKLRGKKETLEALIEERQGQIILAKKRKENIAKCLQLLDYISSLNQTKVVGLFEHTVSCGLKDLFDASYNFRFEMKTRGSSSACDFEIQSAKFPFWNTIVMCRGKSVKEIISTILRIVLAKLDKRSRNIVILDEPCSGVEIDRQSLVGKFLDEISRRFGIQLIIVTHLEPLLEYADKEIRVDGN